MSCRVFLCDDDPGYRALCRAVLEPAGAVIAGEAGSAQECVDTVADVEPDLILLDQKMPGGNGLDALGAIRAARPGAKVVLLSTALPSLYADEARTAGVPFVSKPRDITQLPDELRAALAL